MKKCPSCGYGNPDAGVKCGICAADITAVPARAEPREKGAEKGASLLLEAGTFFARPGAMLLAGLLLLLCGASYFLLEYSPWKKEAPVRSGDNAVTDENSFSYEGVLYSLDKMSSLRFLAEADKRRVPPLLSCPDDKAAHAAARLLGAWARAETDEALAKFWFETLLDAASSGKPVVRRQAAMEAGVAAALGFPVQPYLDRVRKAAAGLVAEKEADLKAAGFFLSSMAGLEDFDGQMRDTLLYDPSPYSKLYAACALSRFGRSEGHEYLSRAASGTDPAVRSEALTCLSYSASPEAERLLLSASRDNFDAGAAEAAKRGIKLREQLAIIKK